MRAVQDIPKVSIEPTMESKGYGTIKCECVFLRYPGFD
jgi:hypothetical protein